MASALPAMLPSPAKALPITGAVPPIAADGYKGAGPTVAGAWPAETDVAGAGPGRDPPL